MSKNQYTVGVLMLIAGVIILLGKLGIFSFIGTIFWPLFLLIPGILLHVLYFGRILPAAILIPGGIMTVYSLVFLYCTLFGWEYLQYIWPFFIVGIAVGLYEYHLFEVPRPRGPMIAALVLAIVAACCFTAIMLWSWGIYLLAALLILGGAWLVFGRQLLGKRTKF
ncbi:hypothetical protein [Paenibacillus sp. 1P07SE]|uniref:hypothetical protein n=1 Tax=Paenibacillus sp. 1P07SE TaxID=3132209 RepID=UPI0039A4EF44